MSNEELVDALRDWIQHNGRHYCYYIEGPDSGMERCPSEFPNLRSYLEYCEIPVKKSRTRIFGWDLDAPVDKEYVPKAPIVMGDANGSSKPSHTTLGNAGRVGLPPAPVEEEPYAVPEEVIDNILEALRSHDAALEAQNDTLALHYTVLDVLVKKVRRLEEASAPKEPEQPAPVENKDINDTLLSYRELFNLYTEIREAFIGKPEPDEGEQPLF